jgi:hypothetical protein
MEERVTVGGLEFFMENRTVGQDGGPSLQVWGAVEGKRVQLLRFDMFQKEPHYHYDPTDKNLHYALDPLTVDDGIGWVVTLLQDKLPQMLARAGYPGLLAQVDTTAVREALPEIERRWRALT